MRKMNKVAKLNKERSHRKAMLANMITSLIAEERIITTKQKAKVLKSLTDKMITRAKKNLQYNDKNDSKALHNKREVMRTLYDRDVIAKLFDDIAVRNKDRNGGYTRIYLLSDRRDGDAAEQAIIELVERKTEEVKSAKSVKSEKFKKEDVKDGKKDKKEKEKKAKK
ncbi:MAG: 50S ribosomal protein L17 [Spirochaetes bacterium]|nr:50S ribosomal protein L17 [Spirochaetota bacterium]